MRLNRTAIGRLLIAALLLAMAAPALAVTINVDSNCSLANAIRSANGKRQKGNKVSCETGNGSDTISINNNATITLNAPLPKITRSVTIVGEGSNGATISGNSRYIIFHFTGPVDATLRNLTLKNGRNGSGRGGAIRFHGDNDNRTLTLDDVIVNNSWAQRDGGGVAVGPGKLKLQASHVNTNTTPGDGGGVWVGSRGTLILDSLSGASAANSRINGNTANRGGGVFSYGTVEVRANSATGSSATRNEIKNNSASWGGGIYTLGGVIRVKTRALIDSNNATYASGSGGGILVASDGQRPNGKLYLNNAHITNNSGVYGGGIFLDSSTMQLTGAQTVSGNTASASGDDVGLYNSSYTLASGATDFGSGVDVWEYNS